MRLKSNDTFELLETTYSQPLQMRVLATHQQCMVSGYYKRVSCGADGVETSEQISAIAWI